MVKFHNALKPKKDKKSKSYKDTKAYKAGWRDAGLLLSKMSVWFVACVGGYSGLCRKTDGSHPKLYAYCEGFNDRIAKAAKKRGLEGVLGTNAPQTVIGEDVK